MGSEDGLNPEFLSRWQAMAAAARAEAGLNLTIGSGTRDIKAQEQLRIKNGCPDVYKSPASSCRVPTAIPGRSNHNHGLAIDMGEEGREWANQNAARFGLHFPVRGENWHVEMIDDENSRGHVSKARQRGAIGFDVKWQDENRNPEDELTDRLDQIMSIVTGGAPTADTPEDAIDDQIATEETTIPGAAGATRGGIGTPGGGLPGGQAYDPKGGVEQWRGLAMQALQYAGEDPGQVDILLRRMKQESGGRPDAINNWDSNAKRGTPSQGLMQTIPSTFQTHAGELADRGILDPFANMVASIRYAKSRYGSLAAAYNRRGGY